MDPREYIKNVTKIDQSKAADNAIWAEKNRERSQITHSRPRGIVPYHMEAGQRASMNRQNSNPRKVNGHKSNAIPEKIDEPNFADITSSVREANGGDNTLSNEVIEHRYKENQQKQYSGSDYNQSSDSDGTFVTLSSGTTASYVTAVQGPNDLTENNINQTSETVNSDVYKKNALMKGLLRRNSQSEQSSSSKSSSKNAISVTRSDNGVGISLEMLNIRNNNEILNHPEDEESMRQTRLGMLLRSEEDEDLYQHPITGIKNDEEWRDYRLRRKGTEVIQTARSYFMNVDDDYFVFQTSQ